MTQVRKIIIVFNEPQWWIGIGLTLLLSSTFVASSGQIGAVETNVFRWFYNWPEILRWPFLVITWAGSIWIVLGLVGILWLKRHKTLAFLAGFAAVTTYALTEALKILVDRPRPEGLIGGVIPKELFEGTAHGFPSGHAAISTVLALILLFHTPKRWRSLILAWPLLVVISRLYLGVHAPLDVVGGVGIGLAVAGFTRLVCTQVSFTIFNKKPKIKGIKQKSKG